MTYTVTIKVNGVSHIIPELTKEEAYTISKIRLLSFIRYYEVECDIDDLINTLNKKDEVKLRDEDYTHDIIIYIDII